MMTKAKAHTRIKELDKQISVQTDALVKATETTVHIHTYLLQKCTDEWCELVNKYGLPVD